MVYACYGSGCEFERSDGECAKPAWLHQCPADMSEEEQEDVLFWREYWQDLKFEESRGN